jgi:Flp pilus assembly protein TadG
MPGRIKKLREHSHNDRGSASLQLVIIFPVVLLIISAVVEGALYYHARNVALAAAQEGLRAARVQNGTANDGAARAQQFINSAGKLLNDLNITPTRTAEQASITVKGTAPSIFAGLNLPQISQTAQGPVERFSTP